MTTAIDLSRLPSPNVIESLDFEQILAERKAYLLSLYPEAEQAAIATALELESEPLNKLLQENTYRELILRQRINDAARAVMLAHAVDSDLDQLGANYNVQRLLIDAGDPTAVPPRAAVYESNADFRRRIQLSPEGYTTAGSEQSYIFHGLSAAPDVADISAISPTPGAVTVYVLSRSGDGAASEPLLATVAQALNQEAVRPMTDNVLVQSANIVSYSIVAELVMLPGPDAAVVRAASLAAAEAYAAGQHAMRRDVTLSGLYAALHQPGVQRVELASPAANIIIGHGEASHCTGITLTVAGQTDV
ncbi:baseplate assembly protein [Stutzerimonas xanthomarina]|uniref:baseplate assembly protein n=1 Tax=Stutzerimonas xanthomarina TaxID=271420 RepID=UPI003AA7F304